ncbi:hypothetical protein FOVG_02157 [Fusarium oxysporum f. sp. pisi HDV247]|uniref:NmrA-like domain-containing protein n=1 Tax=Fusarium oxysporum f. sp. pisi HDV247 TaxID=1080344 RepID=W9QB25_FUSOX|nr:hypothetical protein FOVG_02157 [Fusarium oxysporum f. sp. pisi HDV247]
MKVVAVAGGTGHVGRPIVESLAQSQSFKVLVLGRKTCQDTSGLPASAVYIQVDYDNVEALSQILKHHNVHTLICTIQITDETASSAQVNLIRASDSSSTVKRFIVSAWGSLPNEESPAAAFQAASIEQLRRTNLEWTRFAVGFFLDYYGMPNIKTHLPMLTFALDIPHKKAAIPGTGDEPISFTYTYDVAKFVAAFLDETEWEELTVCYGERTTWNSFLKIAEEVSGQPFEVTYDSVESLQRGAVSELPSHKAELVASPFPEAIAKQLLAILGIWAVNGQFDIQHNRSLNAKYPDIKPMAVRDALLIGMK